MKKKIRAIQYGIGPIGASIVKLLSEKESVDIVGAIDSDPAKIGKDLGEVVGASDGPWGIKVSGDAKGSAGSIGRRGDAHDLVLAAESDGPVAGLPGCGFVRGFDLRRALLSLSHAPGIGRQAGQGGEGIGRGAGGNGRESGIRDGQAGDYAGGGFSAHRARRKRCALWTPQNAACRCRKKLARE